MLEPGVYAKWLYPLGLTSLHSICFTKKEDAINYQMTKYYYDTAQEAFEDFLLIHNATVVTYYKH